MDALVPEHYVALGYKLISWTALNVLLKLTQHPNTTSLLASGP